MEVEPHLLSAKWKIGWGFSAKCNMNCDFCYSRNLRTQFSRTSLELEMALNFIERNHDRINAINFGLGENTLEELWWILIERIRKKFPHISQGITTNGNLSVEVANDDNKKKVLKEAIDEVDVSIDFGTSKEHNRSRNHVKAFNWAIETLRLCSDCNIDKTVVMVAMKDTFKEDNLKSIINIVKRHDANLRINIYRPIEQGKIGSMIDPIEFYKGLELLLKELRVHCLSDPLISAIMGEKKYRGDFSGIASLRILDNGSITPSTYLLDERWIAGNIYRDSDLHIDKIKDTPQFSMFSNVDPPEKCKPCKVVNYCPFYNQFQAIMVAGLTEALNGAKTPQQALDAMAVQCVNAAVQIGLPV